MRNSSTVKFLKILHTYHDCEGRRGGGIKGSKNLKSPNLAAQGRERRQEHGLGFKEDRDRKLVKIYFVYFFPLSSPDGCADKKFPTSTSPTSHFPPLTSLATKVQYAPCPFGTRVIYWLLPSWALGISASCSKIWYPFILIGTLLPDPPMTLHKPPTLKGKRNNM